MADVQSTWPSTEAHHLVGVRYFDTRSNPNDKNTLWNRLWSESSCQCWLNDHATLQSAKDLERNAVLSYLSSVEQSADIKQQSDRRVSSFGQSIICVYLHAPDCFVRNRSRNAAMNGKLSFPKRVQRRPSKWLDMFEIQISLHLVQSVPIFRGGCHSPNFPFTSCRRSSKPSLRTRWFARGRFGHGLLSSSQTCL